MGILWRMCAVVAGVYGFYLFEMLLRKITKSDDPHHEVSLWGSNNRNNNRNNNNNNK